MVESRNGQVVAVFGSSRREEDSELYREAHELGRALAQAGYTVLSGGYGGSMAAVSRGAREAGGQVLGVTCSIFDPLPANTYLSEEIKAHTLIARLDEMVTRADAFIAVQGGIGTLSEVTLAWSLLQTRSLPQKHLILLGPMWGPIVECLCHNSDMGPSIAALASLVSSPAEAVQVLASAPPTPPSPPGLG